MECCLSTLTWTSAMWNAGAASTTALSASPSLQEGAVVLTPLVGRKARILDCVDWGGDALYSMRLAWYLDGWQATCLVASNLCPGGSYMA